ncbi:MAG: VWA-like domain-containing protein [Lachnospiraceae bacterium]|nr:VWA-like domain-containing protein [Lachnospiraceae bacterium]
MKSKDELAKLGKKVLAIVRNELYMDMPYLSRPIGNLFDVMDLRTGSIGTDGANVRFNPSYVCETYLSRPGKLNRTYMHMLLHNLLLHGFVQYPNENRDWDLWNLACDITVESVVDSMDIEGLRAISSDFREECYKWFGDRIRTFTAERIYRDLIENPPDGDMIIKMQSEFLLDDHSFWERENKEPDKPPINDDIKEIPMVNLPLKEVWEKTAEAVRLEAEQTGSETGSDVGRLTWNLKLNRTGKSYRSFLERFMQRREVAGIDPDAFDLSYYTYGMEMYGDMPLIEEQEGREENRLQTLAIAIDTSASTKQKHVKRFLEETYSILEGKDMFFSGSKVFIIECDDRVQKVITLKNPSDIKKYADHFEVSGGYGTDFRPVFTYLKDKAASGEINELRAVLYFTDGYGIYPSKPGNYESIFVFLKDEDYDDHGVPDWAGKVYI